MPVNPVSPNEVVKLKEQILPDEVIQSFNELIAADFGSGRSRVLMEDVITRILQNFADSGKTLTRSDIFDRNYLDVEDIYRDIGWTVEYDRPGYNETYQPYWIFTANTRRKG